MTRQPSAAAAAAAQGDWLAGRVVLVTGAAGQIGRACVNAFAERGTRVAAVDVAPLEGFESSVLTIQRDLSCDAAIEEVFATVESKLDIPEVVVQCAAVYGRTPYLEMTGEMIDRILGTNVRVTLIVGRVAASAMRRRGVSGSIVNLSSTSGVLADAESVGYEASKGAVNMATKGMAVALAPYGIRVNAIAPGSMVKFQEIDGVRDPQDLTDIERARIPLGRLGKPEDIAQVALFLASPAADYMTGAVIYVDGGQLGTYCTVQP